MNAVDIIENTLEDALSPDLVVAVERGLPRKRLVELAARYRTFTQDFRLPPKEPTHLRPFINPSAAEGLHLDRLYLDPFFRAERSGAQDVLKHHLLYAHSLVLHDPLPYHLDFFEDEEEPRGRDDAEPRKRLASYLGFLRSVRELVTEGVLFFADDQPYKMPWLEEHGYWPPYLRDLPVPSAGSATMFRDLEGMATTFIASDIHDGQLDLYVRDPLSLVAFTDMLKSQTVRRAELNVLQGLLRVRVPALEDLSLRDIVEIRKNEETFDRWRRALSRSLSRMQSFGLDGHSDEVRRTVHEEARGELAAVGASVKSVSSIIKEQFRSFCVSSLAASFIGDNADVAIQRAGVSSAANAALSFLSRGSRASANAYQRHVAVLEDVPGVKNS